MASMSPLPFAVALVGVLLAACTDFWKFRLHNALTIPLLVSGLVYHAVVDARPGLVLALLGTVVGGGPFLLVYARGGMGAGDIKLLAAVGAWIGPWPVLHVLIVSGLATGCLSAAILGWKKFRRPDLAEIRVAETAGLGDVRSTACEFPAAGGAACQADEQAEYGRDVAAVLARPDRRWHAVPFGAMIALGVVVTALWLG